MGKSLIFSGITVDYPLQTVTILVTADNYINEYAKLATEVTSEQKNYLKSFIETLMANGLWDKVKCCFPMLGGLNGYNKDLKDVINKRVWNTPEVGTSWDSTRNAPYLNLPGNAKGTPLVIENMDKYNSSFLFSVKLKRKSMSHQILHKDYLYNGGDTMSIIGSLGISREGYKCPFWGTEIAHENLSNYSFDAQANNIYMVTMSEGTNSMFVCSNSDTLLSWKTGSTTSTDTKQASFAFGNFYAADEKAPATDTLNGCMNMFIAFNSALTEEELQVVSTAVWDFDEACGRHIDFE